MTAFTADVQLTSLFPEVLMTERLRLRPMVEEDAESVFARYASDRDVTRYLSWRTHQSVADTHEFLTLVVGEQRAAGGETWAIELRASGLLLGAIGTRVMNDCRVDFGYVLARDAWGQGFATEAAIAVTQAALEVPRIWRVQAMCDVEHSRSARVLEKAGLQFEGTLRRYCILPNRSDRPRDMMCFALVRS